MPSVVIIVCGRSKGYMLLNLLLLLLPLLLLMLVGWLVGWLVGFVAVSLVTVGYAKTRLIGGQQMTHWKVGMAVLVAECARTGSGRGVGGRGGGGTIYVYMCRT